MPQLNHLSCFHAFALHREICEYYLPRTPENPRGLVFPETIGLSYEELIPQVVWRGTDFGYLYNFNPSLRRPILDVDVSNRLNMRGGKINVKTAATHAIRQVYDKLIPRWKGVVWTAVAERDAEFVNRIRSL